MDSLGRAAAVVVAHTNEACLTDLPASVRDSDTVLICYIRRCLGRLRPVCRFWLVSKNRPHAIVLGIVDLLCLLEPVGWWH